MKNCRKKSGFSLVEVIVAIAILEIVIVVFSLIFTNNYKIFRYNRDELGSIEKATSVMTDFEKTTRGATIFYENTANKLTFLTYLRGDNYPAPSKISYYMTGDTLYKSVIPPTASGNSFIYPDTNKTVTTLSNQITNTNLFTYYNENNELIAQPVHPEVVRLVKLDITISGKVPATETTTVQIRNLKTNL